MTVVPVRTSSQTVTKSFSAAVSHRGFLGASAPVPVIPPSASGLLGSCMSSAFCSSGRPAAVSMPSTPASGDGAGLFLMPVGGCRSWRPLSAQRAAVAAATISAATSGCRMSEWAPANEDWDVSQMTVFASAR